MPGKRRRQTRTRRRTGPAAATPDVPRVELAPLSRFSLSPERPIAVHVHQRRAGQRGGDMHLAYELGVVLAGSEDRHEGGARFHLGVGQAWVSTLLEPHHWCAGRAGSRVLTFGFLPALFERMPIFEGFDPTGLFESPPRSGPIGTRRTFRRSLAALGHEIGSRYRGPEGSVLPGPACIDLLRVLALVSQEAPRRPRPGRRPRGHVYQARRIQPAVAMAERSLDRCVSVPEAAHACGMSRSTFDRAFVRVTGLGFATFALRCRLAGAARLLRSTDVPIKAIAYQFGFRHVSHFHRAFVAHYGLTPGDDRQSRSLSRVH